MINISFLDVPIEEELKLKDAMYLTAQPLYKNINIHFSNLHKMVKSDRRQYSPFIFNGGVKKSENWNNDKQDIIILDIDDGLTMKESETIFKGYEYFICTTKSHQKEKKGVICDRYRLILKAVNVPRGDDYFTFTSELEKVYPFIDKQVNTKTGAFLGCSETQFKYYKGNSFDCEKLLEIGLLRKKLREDKKKCEQNTFKTPRSNENDLDIESIKNLLTRECVADIVQSLGYDVNSKFMFKVRNEKTPSCSISRECVIVDFGGFRYGDIFSFITTETEMDFIQSVNYVGGFVNVQIA